MLKPLALTASAAQPYPSCFSWPGQSPFSVIVSFFAPGESVRPNTNEKGEKG